MWATAVRCHLSWTRTVTSLASHCSTARLPGQRCLPSSPTLLPTRLLPPPPAGGQRRARQQRLCIHPAVQRERWAAPAGQAATGSLAPSLPGKGFLADSLPPLNIPPVLAGAAQRSTARFMTVGPCPAGRCLPPTARAVPSYRHPSRRPAAAGSGAWLCGHRPHWAGARQRSGRQQR